MKMVYLGYLCNKEIMNHFYNEEYKSHNLKIYHTLFLVLIYQIEQRIKNNINIINPYIIYFNIINLFRITIAIHCQTTHKIYLIHI